jgi:DNA-binding NarL/FixJ family response regulator
MELRAPNPLHVTESLLHYGNAPMHVLTSLQQQYRLTPTQARVATLLADRLTNAEIALELRVRPTTARRHTEAVLLRLGVTSRFQVVAKVAGIVAEAQP